MISHFSAFLKLLVSRTVALFNHLRAGNVANDKPHVPRLKRARAPQFLQKRWKEMPGKDLKSLSGGAGGEAPCPAEQAKRSDAGLYL